MSLINLKKIELAGTSKFARLDLDLSGFIQLIQKSQTKLPQTIKSKEVLTAMAQSAIDSALESDIIPEKELYKIKPAKSKVKKLDKKGNPVFYKTGDKKGQQRYEPFTPAQYFSYRELSEKERTRNEPIYEDDTVIKTYTSTGNYSEYKSIKLFGKSTGLMRVKKDTKKRTQKYASGTGKKVVGYKKIVDPRKRVREYWKEAKSGMFGANSVYNKTYIKYQEEVTNPNTGKKRKVTEYYMDRPPHLVQTDQTHVVKVKNGVAQIIITSKKPKDKRFYEEGGVQYGAIQYYGPDKNWDRAVDGTTSRWLEVALGLPVPDDIKIQSISGADVNYEKLVKIMRTAIQKEMGAK